MVMSKQHNHSLSLAQQFTKKKNYICSNQWKSTCLSVLPSSQISSLNYFFYTFLCLLFTYLTYGEIYFSGCIHPGNGIDLVFLSNNGRLQNVAMA